MKNVVIIISLFITVSLLIIIVPNSNNEYTKSGKLYINEILASNKNTIKDNTNESSDYIEIYNSYSYEINLENYYLSDNEFDVKKWIFPNIKIKPKEYLIIYTSGLDICDLNSRICHTNFSLSEKGEVVTLADNFGNIISKVKYPQLDTDISYSYYNRKYIKTLPTPGKENNTNIYNNKDKIEYDIRITEYMTHNTKSHYDSYGNYYDWIEIYNNGTDISLKELYISDDKNNLSKNKLPDIIIKSKEYKIIYLKKDTKNYENGIYINFGLSDQDKNIVLSSNNKIIDIVPIVKLKNDMSYGLKNNEWKYFFKSTPGKENTTYAITSLE